MKKIVLVVIAFASVTAATAQKKKKNLAIFFKCFIDQKITVFVTLNVAD